jgi:hypothetical protein
VRENACRIASGELNALTPTLSRAAGEGDLWLDPTLLYNSSPPLPGHGERAGVRGGGVRR